MKKLQIKFHNDYTGTPRMYPACKQTKEFCENVTKTKTISDQAYLWLRAQGYTVEVI